MWEVGKVYKAINDSEIPEEIRSYLVTPFRVDKISDGSVVKITNLSSEMVLDEEKVEKILGWWSILLSSEITDFEELNIANTFSNPAGILELFEQIHEKLIKVEDITFRDEDVEDIRISQMKSMAIVESIKKLQEAKMWFKESQ